MSTKPSAISRAVAVASLTIGLSVLAVPAAPTPPTADEAGATRAPMTSVATEAATPRRVVFIVLDQLRPEFIDAYDMQNVKELMAGGANFPNAYLGHMASETVISHNVMTSGMLPKHMGWSDEWYRDVDGVLGAPGLNYVSGSMSQPQFDALITNKGYPKLADYLRAAFPGTTVATIGEKNYAVYSMSGPGSDIRLTFSGRSYDCDGDGVNNWRGPTGIGVPTYISAPVCNEFYVNGDKALDYGTLTTSPAWMYPLEGNRDFPGYDPAHQGGDVWVTNAAEKVMDNENWSGLFLTYGGLDKAGHMWGGLNDEAPYPGGDDSVHIASMAKIADDQVGRIIDRLEADGLLDETLVVLTTDHAQLTAESFFGVDGPLKGNTNWYYGKDSDETYLSPAPEIQRLVDESGNIDVTMQDSAIRVWLVDDSRKARREAADVVATLGGVRAAFWRRGDRYVLRWEAPRAQWGDAEWAWYQAHGQEIVNTQAADYGPDVVGLLADNTSYGVKGDHGGAQESVQRIPIVFFGAGVKAGTTPLGAIRSVDIMPTILRDLDIPKTHWVDGRAYRIP